MGIEIGTDILPTGRSITRCYLSRAILLSSYTGWAGGSAMGAGGFAPPITTIECYRLVSG